MKLGSKIEYVRKLVKMERKEIAEKLHISQQAYANIENNETA
jgi:DNA-binding XRE family transcriptional regulator